MDSILRAAVVYGFLLVLFRIAGKRTLAQITTFDAVLLLIISEAIQQALLDGDNSLTNAILAVITLVTLDLGLSLLKNRSPRLNHLVEGRPVLLLVDGVPIRERLLAERIDEDDILHAARHAHGIVELSAIRYAVLESSGGITIIPR